MLRQNRILYFKFHSSSLSSRTNKDLADSQRKGKCMKANKKTLMAVKRYLTEPEGYDMDEVISEIVYKTESLKMPNSEGGLVSPDECDIKWGEDEICNLDDFINAFAEKFIENIANVLDSFVGDDIDCYIEDEL